MEEEKKIPEQGKEGPTSLRAESVLANTFVPLSMKGTLANPLPDDVYSADIKIADLSSSIQKIRYGTCPSFPLIPLHGQLQHGPCPTPLRVPMGNDHYFSLFRRQMLLVNKESFQESPLAEIGEDMAKLAYCEAFERLLQAERDELLMRYERYTQYNTDIMTTDKSTVRKFRMVGIAGARPPIQVGDSVLLRTTKPVYRPVMHGEHFRTAELHLQCLSITRNQNREKNGDLIGISYTTVLDKPHTRKRYQINQFHVRIVPRADNHLQCLTAISWLSNVPDDFFQMLMFPNEAPALAPLSNDIPLSHLSGLNAQQLSFARTMVQRTLQPEYNYTRPPVVLTGPAGTGKTKTLLNTIRQLLGGPSLQRLRILVCTSSHTAADVVTRRLAAFYGKDRVFRLYNADRPVETVPIQVLPFACQDPATGFFTLPELNSLFEYDIIVSTCYDAHVLYLAGLTNQQLRLRRMELERNLKMCGVTLPPASGVHEPHFTHLFIDEAAQATEPETLIPLSVVLDPIPLCRKVEIALVGDPRQLSPQVYSTRASQAGLARSWMERLLRRPVKCLGGGDESMLGPDMTSIDALLHYSFLKDGQEQISFFLQNNYRGHPSFLAMPSALFYADKLRWASYDRENRNENLQNKWCEHLRQIEDQSSLVTPRTYHIHKNMGFPIHFRAVVGEDKSHTVTSGTISEESWTNEKEAKAVQKIVECLVKKSSVGSECIGVMAPFREQVFLIRRLLRDQGLSGVNVGTIEDFQGIEMEAIVLSLTRATASFVKHDVDRRIGAFGQRKQANVALTRAEHLLIVVGNPNVMLHDRYWRQWMWFCLRNGLWYGDEGDTRVTFEHLERLPKLNALPERGNSNDCVVVSRLEKILCNISL